MKARHWAGLSLLITWLLLGCQVLFGKVTVHQVNSDSGATCNVGDFRCNGEYLLSCDSQDTGWTLKDTCASGDLCDSKNKTCAVCKDGDFRCSGAERQKCSADHKSWADVELCSAENVCSETSCSGCVTDGQLDCSLGMTLRKCENKVWVNLDECASNALCNATTDFAMTAGDQWNGKCVPAGCPTAGLYECDGSTVKRCPPERDAWVNVDTCDNPALCQAAVTRVNSSTDMSGATFDMCTPACPTANAFFCDGTTLKQCAPDQTAYLTLKECPATTECDPVAGECGALCTPGQFQCNGATLRQCGTTGHWADSATCETAALCTVSADSTTGSCTPSPCVKGILNDYACNGAVLQKCKEDRTGYEDVETCASVPLCEATNSRCRDPGCPVANAYQCFGQDLKQCAADLTEWADILTCPANQYCNSGQNPGCLTSCPANPLRCNGKVLEHCDTATGWTTQATCSTNDLCNCAITDPDGAGPLTNSCAGGLYKDGCGNVVCGGTLAGYKCSGAELQKCQAGRNGWDNSAACGANNLCFAGDSPGYSNGACLTCPTAGEVACNGSVLRTCAADRKSWTVNSTCSLGCVAVQNGNDYCATCKPGAAQCVGAGNLTLQTCGSNQLWTSQTCASMCDAANKRCDACAPSSYFCTESTLNKCSADGQTKTGTLCGSPAQCDLKNDRCDGCLSGQRQCKGANSQKCSTDLTGFVNDTDCGAAGCNAATSNCYQCATNQLQCNAGGTNSQICNSAKTAFVDNNDCKMLGCNTTTNKCNQCSSGQVQCSAGNLQVCSSDKSTFTTGTNCNGNGCNSTASPNKCNNCTPSLVTCNAAGNLVTCSADGSTSSTNTCSNNGCTGGANPRCNACVPKQLQCNAAGNLVTCSNDGGTSTTTSCGGNGCNTSASPIRCNNCTPGTHQCNATGSNLQVCSADGSGFVDNNTCSGLGCNTATNQCNVPVIICTASKYQCAGPGNQTLQQCNMAGTAWSTVATCTATTPCDAAQAMCDACAAGALQCSTAGVPQDCSSSTGTWETNVACTTGTCTPQMNTCDPAPTPPASP